MDDATLKLNWQTYVDETVRRRKARRMTQFEHAAKADVSLPTLSDFENGKLSVTIKKAFDIMRVVDMLDEFVVPNPQDKFVQQSYQRWLELTHQLPENSPFRFPYGYMRLDYELEGITFNPMHKFRYIVQKVSEKTNQGSLLWTCADSLRVQISGNQHNMECWKPNKYKATRDFWLASTQGRMFLIRGYPEDYSEGAFEGLTPRKILDPVVHIHRMIESLFHAKKLAEQMSHERNVVVNWRGLWTGLNGRILRSIVDDTLKGFTSIGINRDVVLEVSLPLKDIGPQLVEHLYPLASKFYGNFDAKISKDFLKRLINLDQ